MRWLRIGIIVLHEKNKRNNAKKEQSIQERHIVQAKKASMAIGFFAATAKVKVASQHDVCIVVEQDRSFVAPAMDVELLLHQVAFLWFVVAIMA